MVDISTSLLSVKKEKIIDTVYKLEDANTNYFHIDVMDGEFVENDTHDIMLEYCEYLNNITKIPLDIHLMVKDVKNFVDSYLIFNPNIITFHCEACKNKEEVMNLINYIKEKGRRVGISIKPETDVKEILEFLPYVHVVLVMTVEPGKGGQELILPTIEKIKELKYPFMLKPVSEGSSIGMYKVNNPEEMAECFDKSAKYGQDVMVEEFIQGKGLTVGVLEDGDKMFATEIIEFRTKTEWYDYEAKYTAGMTEFIIPAELSEEMTKKVKQIAVDAFKACDCRGVSRVDFMVADDKAYVLEINTSPGMTDLSDLPAQSNAMGIDYDTLVQIILNGAGLNK